MIKFLILSGHGIAPPSDGIYLECDLGGCKARFDLPRTQRLRSLRRFASADGWVWGDAGDRCPDHIPGRPLQLAAGDAPPISSREVGFDPLPPSVAIGWPLVDDAERARLAAWAWEGLPALGEGA